MDQSPKTNGSSDNLVKSKSFRTVQAVLLLLLVITFAVINIFHFIYCFSLFVMKKVLFFFPFNQQTLCSKRKKDIFSYFSIT